MFDIIQLAVAATGGFAVASVTTRLSLNNRIESMREALDGAIGENARRYQIIADLRADKGKIGAALKEMTVERDAARAELDGHRPPAARRNAALAKGRDTMARNRIQQPTVQPSVPVTKRKR